MRHALAILVFSGLLLSAGCVEPSGKYVDINIDGNPHVKNEIFVLRGDVNVAFGRTTEGETYSNVRVVLYDRHRQQIKAVPIGNLSTSGVPENGDFTTRVSAPGQRLINITSTQRPTYVVVESPDFWTSENELAARAYVWNDSRSQYVGYWYESPSEKFPSPTMTPAAASETIFPLLHQELVK